MTLTRRKTLLLAGSLATVGLGYTVIRGGDDLEDTTGQSAVPNENSSAERLNAGETSTAEQRDQLIWSSRFDDPPSEATKPFGARRLQILKRQLKNHGWVDINDHVQDGLVYTRRADGSYALGFRYPEGERMGCDLKRPIGAEEAWARFSMKFEDGFDVTDNEFRGGVDWAHGGKFPGWLGTLNVGCAGGGDGPCDGTDSWSARGMFWDPKRFGYEPHDQTGKIALSYYVYHAEQTENYGDTQAWKRNDAGVIDSGQWYDIILHAEMNDIGETNGVLEAWVDGVKAYEKRDWVFRRQGGHHLDVGAWWHVSYFGGQWTSPQEQRMYTDNLEIYDGIGTKIHDFIPEGDTYTSE